MKLKHLFEHKELTASQAYDLAKQKGTCLPEYEDVIAKDAHYAYFYAKDLKGRFPEAEPAIAKNSHYAFDYIKDVIKERWPEAEHIIADNAFYAYVYARDIIKGRWPKGELAITKDSRYNYLYKILLYDLNINFDDLESPKPKKKGPLVIDEHIISNIPNTVKDSQLIKIMKLSFPNVENTQLARFLKSKQLTNKKFPQVMWKEYINKKTHKYQSYENDFS